jgi:hypothetical protein
MHDTAIAALIAASLATVGWVYTARRARALSRKQHTITVMLQASFNKEFQEHIKLVAPILKGEEDHKKIETDQELRIATRKILNHYEFIAAGLRNGDFDEQLVMDSERTAIVQLYAGCEQYIWSLRENRKRMSTYEHLEWLHARWTNSNRNNLKSCIEWLRQKPFQGNRHDHKKTVAG